MSTEAKNGKYPKMIDDYFKNNEVVIKTMRDDFRVINEKHLPNKVIKSAKQFIDYVNKEKDFWCYDKIGNNHMVANYPNSIKQSVESFNTSINCANQLSNEKISEIQKETYTKQSLNAIVTAIKAFCNCCHIASTTNLAELFKRKAAKESYYFNGFETAIVPRAGQNSYYQYNAWYEGYIDGVQYKKTLDSIQEIVETNIDTLKETAEQVSTQFSELISKSTTDYHEQEEKIKKLWIDNEQEINQQKQQLEKYIIAQKQEMSEFVLHEKAVLQKLETTYQEKLRLSKPAEYWNTMEMKYRHSGIIWLIICGSIALLTVGILLAIIIFIPNLYETNEHWFDTVRNTALLTVITSIAIYILRITIKLAMSSYHLSRDAKEREQLTYFYLSLINESAVTDKERNLIVTSLFSRSDTGLLKGDSSPSMPNISDIMNKDSGK